MELLARRLKLQKKGRGPALGDEEQSGCTCRCLPYLRAYREDLGICVDDIHGEYMAEGNGLLHFAAVGAAVAAPTCVWDTSIHCFVISQAQWLPNFKKEK